MSKYVERHNGIVYGLTKLLEKSYIDVILFIAASFLTFLYYWAFSYIKIIAIIISVIGFIIWIVARNQLGTSFQLVPEAKKLVTHGIYSRIRHPIYFGGFLVTIGNIIYTLNTRINLFWILVLLFNLVIQTRRIKLEETALLKRFKGKWVKYKEGTWF